MISHMKSRMRESCKSGSVRGASCKRCVYSTPGLNCKSSTRFAKIQQTLRLCVSHCLPRKNYGHRYALWTSPSVPDGTATSPFRGGFWQYDSSLKTIHALPSGEASGSMTVHSRRHIFFPPAQFLAASTSSPTEYNCLNPRR